MQGIRYKSFIFSPGIIPTVVTIALLYIMVSLGLWQLDRADYKAGIQSSIDKRKNIPAVDFGELNLDDTDWEYRVVNLSGLYDTEKQILLDNQVNNTQAGYKVFTPLKINDTTAVLVNRGWIKVGKSREKLPDITVASALQAIKGVVSQPPSKVMVLSEQVNEFKQWPMVVQYIDILKLEEHLDYKLLPVVINLSENSPTGLVHIPLKINMKSDKHIAYAFQWFALSLTLLIIYMFVNTKHIKKDIEE